MANYLDKRAQRITEIFEEERDDVLACNIMREAEKLSLDCDFCNCKPFCKKVFEEEAEGGGG